MTTARYLGRVPQGEDEELYYTNDTSANGGSPTDVAVVAKDLSNDSADVSSTVLDGSSSVSGDVITLPKIKSLTAGNVYRIEIKYTCGNNVFEDYLLIDAEV